MIHFARNVTNNEEMRSLTLHNHPQEGPRTAPPEPNFWHTKRDVCQEVGSSWLSGTLPNLAGDNPFPQLKRVIPYKIGEGSRQQAGTHFWHTSLFVCQKLGSGGAVLRPSRGCQPPRPGPSLPGKLTHAKDAKVTQREARTTIGTYVGVGKCIKLHFRDF